MNVTLVLPEFLASELNSASRSPLETAGVLLVRPVPIGNEVRLLARKIRWVSDQFYHFRGDSELSVASEGYVHALAEAESEGCVCLWLHTHPGDGASPQPSAKDRVVDQKISGVFRIRSGSKYYGTLILSSRGEEIAFSGTLADETENAYQISRILIVGSRLKVVRADQTHSSAIPKMFDRSIRAFGSPVQTALASLRVGIVGNGGTGSAVAEQLVRLGVRHITLFDKDTLTESNITRVYGSTPADVGNSKARILAEHLRSIAPDLTCVVVEKMITVEAAARKLVKCEVVFGCTDDNAGRLVLSRLATYFLIPVIDCGVLLSSDSGGTITGIHGRITVCEPGNVCLVCRGRIDLQRAAVELQTPEERNRLANEGYAPALERVEPAVVAYTTAVAAGAVAELLERLIGYGPTPRPTEILLRLHDREISTNAAEARSGHYCDRQSGKLGLGFTEPFLEQLWPI